MIRNIIIAATLALATVTSAFAAGKIDINRASAAELADGLNGIGNAKAEAIVEYREKNGPFKTADQLAEVRGIGLKTIDKNREVIAVGAAAEATKPASAH